jgi:hypothetical protein
MKTKRTLFLMMLILSLSFIMILGPVGNAQNATISITNVRVDLVETREPIGNRVIHVYNIIAILHNSGDSKSDEITVNFYDPEFNKTTTPPLKLSPLNASLNPNEDKIFTLSSWPTPLIGGIPINISFAPSSPDSLTTNENSGYYVYTLSINGAKKTTSTPGFEIACILCAIMILVIGRKIKK